MIRRYKYLDLEFQFKTALKNINFLRLLYQTGHLTTEMYCSLFWRLKVRNQDGSRVGWVTSEDHERQSYSRPLSWLLVVDLKFLVSVGFGVPDL